MMRQVSVGLLQLIVDHYSTFYPYLRGTVEGDDSVALFHLIGGLDISSLYECSRYFYVSCLIKQ